MIFRQDKYLCKKLSLMNTKLTLLSWIPMVNSKTGMKNQKRGKPIHVTGIVMLDLVGRFGGRYSASTYLQITHILFKDSQNSISVTWNHNILIISSSSPQHTNPLLKHIPTYSWVLSINGSKKDASSIERDAVLISPVDHHSSSLLLFALTRTVPHL